MAYPREDGQVPRAAVMLLVIQPVYGHEMRVRSPLGARLIVHPLREPPRRARHVLRRRHAAVIGAAHQDAVQQLVQFELFARLGVQVGIRRLARLLAEGDGVVQAAALDEQRGGHDTWWWRRWAAAPALFLPEDRSRARVHQNSRSALHLGRSHGHGGGNSLVPVMGGVAGAMGAGAGTPRARWAARKEILRPRGVTRQQ